MLFVLWPIKFLLNSMKRKSDKASKYFSSNLWNDNSKIVQNFRSIVLVYWRSMKNVYIRCYKSVNRYIKTMATKVDEIKTAQNWNLKEMKMHNSKQCLCVCHGYFRQIHLEHIVTKIENNAKVLHKILFHRFSVEANSPNEL